MKRIISAIIALCLLCSLALMVASCDEEHVHSFSEEWKYDEASHWNECVGDACLEIANKADHTWGETTVVEEATPDSEGTSERKCSVCGATENSSVAFAGISEEKWTAMISDTAFENYTLTVEGTMTVLAGEEEFVSPMKSICKMTSDKIAITTFDFDQDGNANASDPIVLDGELALSQKIQNSQIFLIILQEFENFEYDTENNVYKINETITLTKDLKGFSISPDGNISELTIPTTIIVKDAVATLSNDGKILSLVCDYTQSMNMDGGVTTKGLTTWTFSDYGTTTIG